MVSQSNRKEFQVFVLCVLERNPKLVVGSSVAVPSFEIPTSFTRRVCLRSIHPGGEKQVGWVLGKETRSLTRAVRSNAMRLVGKRPRGTARQHFNH